MNVTRLFGLSILVLSAPLMGMDSPRCTPGVVAVRSSEDTFAIRATEDGTATFYQNGDVVGLLTMGKGGKMDIGFNPRKGNLLINTCQGSVRFKDFVNGGEIDNCSVGDLQDDVSVKSRTVVPKSHGRMSAGSGRGTSSRISGGRIPRGSVVSNRSGRVSSGNGSVLGHGGIMRGRSPERGEGARVRDRDRGWRNWGSWGKWGEVSFEQEQLQLKQQSGEWFPGEKEAKEQSLLEQQRAQQSRVKLKEEQDGAVVLAIEASIFEQKRLELERQKRQLDEQMYLLEQQRSGLAEQQRKLEQQALQELPELEDNLPPA